MEDILQSMKEDLTEASIQPLLDYFDGCIPLNGEEKQLLSKWFEPRFYRRIH